MYEINGNYKKGKDPFGGKKKMLCCYYPAMTLFLDDDLEFLKTTTRHVDINNSTSYSSPNKVIDLLQNQNPFNRITKRILTNLPHEDTENISMQVNIRKLHEEIYSAERFQDVAVMIVDYHMGDVNGIEVWEKLSHHPSKKILLTGGVDKDKIAIDAFNKNIIHRFINKSDPNFVTQLKQAVVILKEAYFRELAANIIPHDNANIFNQASYINFIRNIHHQLNAVEYYQLDSSGSLLLLDNKGILHGSS